MVELQAFKEVQLSHPSSAGEKVIGVPKSVRVQIAQAAAGQPARAHGC